MNEPIRIAQIMGKLWAGGVEMMVFNYYRAIDKTKIQFDFYYDEDSTVEPPQDLIDMGARFIKIPPYQKLPRYLKTLEQCFEQNQYTIVHSHINTLSVFPLYAAWKSRIPVRIAHNHSVPGGESYKRTFLKYFLRFFSTVFPTDYFSCSEKAGRWLFGNKNFNNGKVVVIKNAVDFGKFHMSKEEIERKRKELGITGKFVIGHIGRFTFAKNHRFLLETFKKITIIREDAVLLLVGDGELHDQIHTWVNELGLTDKVIFAGQVNNPEKYYCLADVMVIPSIFEGLSLATIESQAAGIPAVVSTSIPDEAVISNGCIRLSLDDETWAETIIKYEGKEVVLDDRSKAYEIEDASKRLEGWYLMKYNSVYIRANRNQGGTA